MNNTLNKRILSPLQPKVKPVIDVRGENHPVREEVKRLCGNPFTLEVSFQEDTETLKNLNIPGLVGVLCTLKLNGSLIAFGRSVSVFSKLNKYLDRTISSSINGSFLSATNNAVKILESIRANGSEEMEGFEEPEMTEKQRQYLDRLVLELDDPEDRERYLNQINSGLSRQDASDLIASLVPVR
ncbi:hypothetical protein A3A95_04070 [Candidatus Nomurabacteria bacterium RIFCSPLOWO2_01_FULL_39_18]|uniref:Uncharacterized protein n=1 Tax=Candidatus Nomurabacteria bacterium RIFCSPHIGHO2_01_FULL_40_24b TaxID=1801739 RepID=A0A1F6V601_9BACT|nr:MAG: hypothetical protein A2647_04450 [Candidatus Nomurabacteria bacterium RIFCSPHIGHO2_01_FULL_40_24b]OGI89277.1 MAG: hypothetical protein A3A95_04070 [Candidatus Nomurabacteria bacterium RIFCSPLOWO2_01_FULL_39_18]